MNEWWAVYLYGFAVWSVALMSKMTWRDIAASMIIGAIWPVHVPAMIMKRILR